MVSHSQATSNASVLQEYFENDATKAAEALLLVTVARLYGKTSNSNKETLASNDRVSKEVEAMRMTHTTLNEKVGTLQEDMDQIKVNTQDSPGQFDSIEQRLDSIEERLGGQKKTAEMHAQRLDHREKDIEKLREELDDHRRQMGTQFQAQQEQQTSVIKALRAEIAELRKQMAARDQITSNLPANAPPPVAQPHPTQAMKPETRIPLPKTAASRRHPPSQHASDRRNGTIVGAAQVDVALRSPGDRDHRRWLRAHLEQAHAKYHQNQTRAAYPRIGDTNFMWKFLDECPTKAFSKKVQMFLAQQFPNSVTQSRTSLRRNHHVTLNLSWSQFVKGVGDFLELDDDTVEDDMALE